MGGKGDELLERSSLDTAAALTGRDAVDTCWKRIGAVVCLVLAIPGHAIIRAVEHGGVNRVKGCFAPVPVLKFENQISCYKVRVRS